MKDEEKTEEQLRDELTEMRQRLAELEAAETERTQAKERLRQERDFSSILIHASPVFFVAIGADGKTLMMNETMLSSLGYRTDEVVGVDYLTRFVPEGDRESLSQIFEKLTKSNVPTTNENRVLTKDGRELLVEWHGRPVFTEGGEFDFFFGAGIDITERKIAQEKIEHLNLVLRAIRNVNQLIASEKDRDRLLQGACDSLIETRGYHTAWIGLFDEEKSLVGIAQAGWSEESAVPVTDLQHGWSPVCVQRILAEPEVQVIESPHSTCGDCSLSDTHRDRGVLAVRLKHAGKVYGMLAASIPVGLISDDEEHALLAEVAADIAFALYSIELEAERKRTEKALNLKLKQLDALSSASHAVSASLDPKQVLERIVSLAREAVGADYTSVMLVDRASDTVRSAEDFSGVPSIEYRIRTKGLTSLIMDRGAAVIIDEIGEDGTITPDLGAGAPRLINPHIMKANIKSVAGLPLTGKDRSLGVLYLHSLQPWAFHDQETLLTTFANQAAIAVENARLYERVSQEL
ncbi:GAF domain-containing protein, partial [Candidatus Bipolaricaulota bacterium]|nr:GAF domain-containing protein [Candidatus Bipolaricaulota bacterium]